MIDIRHEVRRALDMDTKLPSEVMLLPGMSGVLGRILLNNICSYPGARYLEIGTHAGSTLISAGYGNYCDLVAIDNWSEDFGHEHVRDTLLERLGTFGIDCTLIEADYRSPETPVLVPPNRTVLFADGFHDVAGTVDQIVPYQQCMADEYVMIVDDWILDAVQAGVREALAAVAADVVDSLELNVPRLSSSSTWWNGLFVATMRQR